MVFFARSKLMCALFWVYGEVVFLLGFICIFRNNFFCLVYLLFFGDDSGLVGG